MRQKRAVLAGAFILDPKLILWFEQREPFLQKRMSSHPPSQGQLRNASMHRLSLVPELELKVNSVQTSSRWVSRAVGDGPRRQGQRS